METKKYNSFFANVLLADFEIVELHKKLKNLIADNKMTTKQTAVDWLINKVEEHFCLLPVDLIEQAKEIEKEQIAEAFNNSYWFIDGQQYYEKTYGE